MENKNRRILRRRMQGNIVVLLVFGIAMMLALSVMRWQLFDNAKEQNFLLLDNYVDGEENTLNTYNTLLNLMAGYVEEKERANASFAEIKSGLYPYLSEFDDLYSEDSIRSYGIVDGHILSKEEGLKEQKGEEYDYTQMEWYREALLADGKIYATDAYRDEITGKMIVTLSKKVKNSNSVMAFDVFFDDFHTENDILDLPENAAYYMCDREGTVLFYDTKVYDSYDDIQTFVKQVLSRVENETEKYIANYEDAAGKHRSAFVRQMSGGGTVILTIPRNNAVGGMNTLYLVVGAIFVIGVLLISYLVLHDYRREKKNQTLEEQQAYMVQTQQIYQKAMKSTMQAYREVCYLDLHQNSFYIVYPEDVERARAGRYQEGLKNLFRIGILQCREEDEAERVLGMENIKTELKEKDYIEVRCGHRSKDGEIESCVITVSVTDRVDGEPVSATLAIRSIENVLRQEQAQREILTMAVQRAEAANHAKSDFLSNMSHDIRTPLNAILGMTEIARIHIGEKDRVEDALNKIAVSGKHLLGLVNSVLDMSKIENGKITLEEADFDLYETIDEIQTLFLGQLQEKDLHFLMEKEEITHRYVYGDEQRLSRIFVNIMGNAVKFTPAGGKIFFLAREKNSDIPGRGFYEFVFEDSGIGMTQEFMDHIFEPFTRAVDSRTNRIEGTGLGMPIAVNVAKMMGGDIKVESQPGKGSRFTVTVYLKIKDSLEMEENPENESGLKSLGECDFSGKKVLLVEDNELNVEVASEILAIAGFEVTTAKNGKEAVEIFAGKDMGYFDLILMDVQMPVMNGYEATREIRHLQREDAWSIPIIAMTANAFADDIQDAMEAGMNAHLSKPLDIHKLKQCLKEFF